MVLNYKNIPYTQSYISYPDIAPLLKELNVPPHAPGTNIMPHTLPAIVHKSSVKSNPSGALMDSFPIVQHLDKHFPSPPLFPSGDASHALNIAVQKILGNVMGKCYMILFPYVPDILDPRGKEYFIHTRSELFGKPLADVRPKNEEEARVAMDAAKKEFAILAEMLKGSGQKAGPFFEGDKPGFVDIVLVSYLAWIERFSKKLWQEIISVGNGEFTKLWDACLPWVEGQGEEKAWEVAQ